MLLYYCLVTMATVSACHMPCCPVFLSLYCIVIVTLNEINGDRGRGLFFIKKISVSKGSVTNKESI